MAELNTDICGNLKVEITIRPDGENAVRFPGPRLWATGVILSAAAKLAEVVSGGFVVLAKPTFESTDKSDPPTSGDSE
jgi:hypothetical protein